jgi:hypothetical protein
MLNPIHSQGRPVGSDPPVSGKVTGGAGVAVGVGGTTGVSVGVAVGPGVGVSIGATTGVSVGVGAGVSVVGVAVGVSVVGVAVGVSVVGVAVGVSVVGVAVGVSVGVGSSVGVMTNDGAASVWRGRLKSNPTRQKRPTVNKARRVRVALRCIGFLLKVGVIYRRWTYKAVILQFLRRFNIK